MHSRLFSAMILGMVAANYAAGNVVQTGEFPVQITVDAGKTVGELKPVYRFFGADEPNYAYMKDGEKLLNDLGKLGPNQVYFRAHSLMSSGDGTPALKWGSTNIYTEDAQGNPVYDWTIVDRIFDTYRKNNVKPLVQMGFMPEALSTNPQPYRHEWRPGLPYKNIITGWAYPPKDYNKWRELCFQWVKHCIERYGQAEVATWYFECWNEPDGDYWKGSHEDWFKLNDYTVDGIRRALPTAKVGGPHTANGSGRMSRAFYEHITKGKNYATGETGTKLDYLSFHAKGSPKFVEGRVQMGIANQLRAIDNSCKLIAEFPEIKHLPIIIGESDPEGCAACQGPQLSYRNGTVYSSYTAASFARKQAIAEARGTNLEGALTWAFEFEDQPYFAGFRALATNGVNLPVLNVFRMLGKMSGQRVEVSSSSQVPLEKIIRDGVRETPDVGALVSADGSKLFVFAWHYHDDDLKGPAAAVDLMIAGLADGSRRVTQYLIDETHSNSYGAWKRMGSPIAPNTEQYAELKAAGQLATAREGPGSLTVAGGKAAFKFNLARQGVTLFVIEP